MAQTAIVFLNNQVFNLSTTVSNIPAGVSPGTFTDLSTSVSTLIRSNFTNLSTYTSSLTGQVDTNSTSIGFLTSGFDNFSTAQTSINEKFDGLSSFVSTLQLETVSTGVQALQTFSTAQTSANTRFDGVSTTLSTTISTNTAQTTAITNLQTFSTAQTSANTRFNIVSTTLTTAISTNTAQALDITGLQTFSTSQTILNTVFSETSSQVVNLIASTGLLNFNQTRGQIFQGPFSESGGVVDGIGYGRWGSDDGTSARGTSTLMNAPVGFVSLINNTSTTDVILPLYMGIATNGYTGLENMVPSSIFDTMRFAHIGVPGRNSSITINLISSGSATSAVTLGAGEIITLLFRGTTISGSNIHSSGPSSPSNYFFIPSL